MAYLHLSFEQCLLVLSALSAFEGSQSSSNIRFPQDNDWHETRRQVCEWPQKLLSGEKYTGIGFFKEQCRSHE